MANPITWQNVNGPSLTDAAAPMLAAQRSFDSAFSRLGDELTRREATNTQNWQTGKTNNTEAFLAEMSKYATPEELQAAQQSGALDQMRQGFGAQVDQSAIRQAGDLRPGLLQERVMKQGAFADDQMARVNRPVDEALKAAVASGDSNTFNQLIEANPNLPNRAAHLQAWTAQQANVEKARRDSILFGQGQQTFNNQQTAFTNEQALAPGKVALQQAQIGAAAQQVKASDSQIRVNDANLIERQAENVLKAAKAKSEAKLAAEAGIVKGTALENGDMRGGNAMSKVQEVMGKLKDVTPQNINEMYTAIEQIAPGGYFTATVNGKSKQFPVPVSVVNAAIQGAYDSWSPFSDHGDAVRDYISKAMQSPALQDEITGVEGRRRLLEAVPAASSSKPASPGTTSVTAPSAQNDFSFDSTVAAIKARKEKQNPK